jgi:thiol:disulfide interchange protein DsbD
MRQETMVAVGLMLSASLWAETVNGRQAQVTTSASTGVAHSGQRITLAVEVNLRPGVHVYAPGVEGYIPISWTLEKSAAYEAHDVEMPAAHKLYLEAIDETAPVYEGRFRLVRDVTVGPDVHEGRLSIAGTLRYQACDDRMCYKPEKLPLGWTLVVEPRK